MTFEIIGAISFGLVIGWITYRTLARRTDGVAISDIATVLGSVGGAAAVGLFDDGQLFAAYSVGLAVGFFGYLAAFAKVNGREKLGDVMGRQGTVSQDV
jgi:hypothetical protein